MSSVTIPSMTSNSRLMILKLLVFFFFFISISMTFAQPLSKNCSMPSLVEGPILLSSTMILHDIQSISKLLQCCEDLINLVLQLGLVCALGVWVLVAWVWVVWLLVGFHGVWSTTMGYKHGCEIPQRRNRVTMLKFWYQNWCQLYCSTSRWNQEQGKHIISLCCWNHSKEISTQIHKMAKNKCPLHYFHPTFNSNSNIQSPTPTRKVIN